jgi:hypothetical protein
MRAAIYLLILGLLSVQNPPATTSPKNPVYVCPMHPNSRSSTPGKCPIAGCGMEMSPNIPDQVEYHMALTVKPNPPKAGQTIRVDFAVHDPVKDLPVTNFQIIHEKLFHAFFISQDLQFFLHEHPVWSAVSMSFHYDLAFPKPGMYRVLGDFYPDGATPQLIAKTVIVPGAPPAPVKLIRDYSPKDDKNMKVELVTVPPQAVAAQNTQLRFHISPAEGIEQYLAAWGHMLSASDDLIDLAHVHPFIADGGPDIQFNMVFPRARMYRVWVQFQRKGVVNTVHFDIPVKELQLESGK